MKAERGFSMAQPSRTLFHRIRCIKSSLDKAEQSFLDNKDIRGELDLMLAEAELKNLRRKKDRPWSWNRQLLAGCVALLLVVAGAGGWYIAKDHYRAKAMAAQRAVTRQTEQTPATEQAAAPVAAKAAQAAEPQTIIVEKPVKQDVAVEAEKPAASRVTISKADMHKLVQSARVELSNSN